MTISAARKFWLALALSLGVVAGVLALVAYGVGYLRTSWEVLGGARREIAILERRDEDLRAALETLARLESEQAIIAAGFSNPADPLPFIELIEELGRRSGVRAELTVAPSASGRGGGEWYMLLAEGKFSAVMAFSKNLESLPFLAEFGNVELRRVSGILGPTEKERPESALRLSIMMRPLKS